MAHPSPTPIAGGALIAFGCIAGAIGGAVTRQPSIGFLVGLTGGIVLALLIWWRDRSR